MNGVVIIDKLTDDIERRVVLVVGHILTIQQRLVARRRRRRDRIDGLECVLEHDRVGVLGRKFNRQLERLLANVCLGQIRLPVELEHAKMWRYYGLLLELFGVLFRIRDEQIIE